MSLGLAHRKELQKRRNNMLWTISKTIFVITLIIGCSYYAFDIGQVIALRSVDHNKDRFDKQTTDMEKLRVKLGNTEAALDKMEKLIPNQQVQNLLLLINRKTSDGISPERMTTLISGLSKDHSCDDISLARRFTVLTPISNQTESSASFFRGLITVTGKGSPTLNENGSPEAWYDPKKSVTIFFTLPGGEIQNITGILPLYHSVVLKNKEYRFTVTSGQKSFADTTVRSCSLQE